MSQLGQLLEEARTEKGLNRTQATAAYFDDLIVVLDYLWELGPG